MLQQDISEFNISLLIGGMSEKTREQYRNVLCEFSRYCSRHNLEVNEDTVQNFIDDECEILMRFTHYEPDTPVIMRTVIHTFITWRDKNLQELSELKSDDLSHKDQSPVLTKEKIIEMFEYFDFRGEFRNRIIFDLYLKTGCCSIELSNLNLNDFDASQHTLVFRNPKRGERKAMLDDTLTNQIEMYIHNDRIAPGNEPALFVTKFGKRITDDYLAVLIKKVLTAIQITSESGQRVLQDAHKEYYC